MFRIALRRGLRPGVARTYATQVSSYFEIFPKNFPAGGPPADSFKVNPRLLRREYRSLQSQHHPDIVIGSSALAKNQEEDGSVYSSLINKGYATLKDPHARLAHFIELHHPDHLDISQDEVAKGLIAQFQSSEFSLDYKDMLMTVLEAHESLEMATNEADLEGLSAENDARIAESETVVEKLLKYEPINWNDVVLEALRLKYWVNIQNGIKEWEPGKPVHLTH